MSSHREKGSPALPFVVFPVLGALCFATGCADVAGDALHQDVAQLRQDVNALKLAANRSRGEADAIAQAERRLREQSTDTTRQVGTLSTRLEAIAAELNRVSNRLDDVSRRLEAASRQPTPARPPATTFSAPSVPASPPPVAAAPPAGIPGTRIGPSAPPTPSTPPVVAAPPVPAPSMPAPSAAVPSTAPRSSSPTRTAGGATAEEAYQAAYLDFSRGRYELALTGFRDFLRRYPDSPLADSAQYGIGEAYFSMATTAAGQGQTDRATRALEQAVQEFRKVVVVYPRGAKVPSALYKEGLSLSELKQPAMARARLQYLVDHFPQSEEAPLAKERLAALK